MKIPEYVALPYAIIFVSCIMDLDTCVDSHENLKVLGHLLVHQQIYFQGTSVVEEPKRLSMVLFDGHSSSKPPS